MTDRGSPALVATAAYAVLAVPLLLAQAGTPPTVDQLVSLQRIAGPPALSPGGDRVAFVVRETDWEADRFDTEIWLADTASGAVRQLTRANRSSSAPAWAPDGRLLAFTSDRSGTSQVYLIDPSGGEARALTSGDEGVRSFAWSPDGRTVAFTVPDPKAESLTARDERYGAFEVVDDDHRMTHLHSIDVASGRVRRLTDGPYTVGRFEWSPDGRAIAFDHRLDDDPSNRGTADLSVVDVADGRVRRLVEQAGPDANPRWSPDGTAIVFETAMAAPFFYYENGRLATIPAGGGTPTALALDVDEDPSLVGWGPDGVLFAALERTNGALYRMDPAAGSVTRLGPDRPVAAGSFVLSKDFRTVAFVASDAGSLPEVFVADLPVFTPRRLSDLSSQIAGWTIGTREVIRWTSRDGTEIEGILHKPSDFQPGRRYPLLVVIHGGPTGISRPTPISAGFAYPVERWLARGALILQPNYRGSAGYGEAFRSLNVRNLGVGDAWDVISGIDHLAAQGLVDPDRVGTMGWSQGGYISAFLATHDSPRFRAVSVGAGISNWMTYYVNTDIHPFTRQYLKSTPWDDPGIYAKTSPMTYVTQASAPTLIQHGENDRRVPPPNAFELYQGLQDQGVPTKLIIYKGFGHGLDKPKAQRAAMEHNLEWFDRYLFGDGQTPSEGR